MIQQRRFMGVVEVERSTFVSLEWALEWGYTWTKESFTSERIACELWAWYTHFPLSITRLGNCTLHQYRHLRPNSLYNLLTRRTFDEAFALTHDSHFNCVSNTIFKVLAFLPSLTDHLRVGPRVDRPTGRQSQSQVPHAVTIFSQNTNREDVTDLCTASGEWPSTYTLVSPKMNTVDQERENDSLIPIPLYVSIFLL